MTKKVRNYMEDIVNKMIDEALRDMDVCKCEVCQNDMKALALNELLPKYIASIKGEEYIKTSYLEPKFEEDAISSLTRAAIKVNNKKRHD